MSCKESTEVNIETSMVIENGEDIIGYQYLHGTNADVGGFQIIVTIEKSSNGDVTYRLTYIWNDIMDPNLEYSSDTVKAEFAKKIPFATMNDYTIKIIWKDTTIIRENPTFWKGNKGWLSK